MMQQQTICLKGVTVTFDVVEADGHKFTIAGKFLKIASLGVETTEWLEDVNDPEAVIQVLKSSPAKVDLFRFWQRIPDSEAKFPYYKEWKHVAAIPISTPKHWLDKQVNRNTRRKIRFACEQGVVVTETEFTDEFVREMMVILNQSPVRQGRRFWHYGKDFETVKRDLGQDMGQSIFLAARLQGELIGFIKLYFADRYAMVTLNLDKTAHREKTPISVMIAKAVEVCALRRMPFLTYTVWRRGGLEKFQASHGFEKIPVPEYFIPLTWKGRLALRLRLHNGLKALIPEPAMARYLAWRARYYAIKYGQKADTNGP